MEAKEVLLNPTTGTQHYVSISQLFKLSVSYLHAVIIILLLWFGYLSIYNAESCIAIIAAMDLYNNYTEPYHKQKECIPEENYE